MTPSPVLRRALMAVLVAAFGMLPALLAAGSAPVLSSLVEDGVRFERIRTTTFRWMSILKVYDASLHLGEGESPSRILADIPTRLHITYHRSFSAAQIVKGGDTLLAKNVDASTLEALKEGLDRINRAYRDVKAGDSYTLTYVPGRGTTLRLNGTPLDTIPGHDFAAAYFRIWFGESPISPSMRDALLAR